MKTLMLATLMTMIMLLALPASAEQTVGTNWDQPQVFMGYLNHGHGYEKYEAPKYEAPKEYEAPLGLGIDLVLCEIGDVSIEAQNKYDFNNEVYSGYLVGKFHLWNMFTKDK